MTTEAHATEEEVSDVPADAKQPPALYLLFGTEAWERFSYYGMRAILVLYMMKVLGFAQADGSKLYGWYTGLVYLTPLLGGYMADRVMGYRKAIIMGGFVMAIGEFFLAVSSRETFYIGLLCLIVGNGFFKPNISTVVGTLYKAGDPRRDRGFTIFYMGINLGAFFSPLVCGQLLGENPALGAHGFNYGFAAAGIGMLIGNFTFMLGHKVIKSEDKLGDKVGQKDFTTAQHDEEKAERAREAATPLTKVEKDRILAILITGVFVIFFWMAFEQAGNTLTTWADQKTNQSVFGLFNAKASLFQAVNPLFVVALAPLVSEVWKKLAEKNLEPSSPMKMVLGLSLLGLGFVPMVIAALIAGDGDGRASWVFLVLTYMLHTVGELCLSPVGLSFVTKLAPKKMAALFMGVWFFAVFMGNVIAGQLGSLYGSMSAQPHGAVKFFAIFVATSLGAAFVMFVTLKPIRRLMHGVH